MPTLVLWDIDLTLLDLRRLGGRWFQRALADVTGGRMGQVPSFAGRTDRWIATRMLESAGVEPTDDLIDRLHAEVIRLATADQERMAEVGVVLPGVPTVLKELAGRPDVVQTLVTGNLRPVAKLKVATFGLDEYLDLEIGGYGGTSERRSVLVDEALTAAERRHGSRFTGSSVVVVGDTPHDVDAALEHGARAVAVATGRFTAAELTASGAHVVLPDLGDTTRALDAILP
ncbi:MAG TPA: haloacid dehalogenase-like hydrolase [Pseudonocardiaceae bacterium]|jgi:phosphoglycolate phosphatase-like HAD superfamily hydrolase|nr:haloacid dehalogenase-like hydrolase [Pseudonocardiaceae bacterium]